MVKNRLNFVLTLVITTLIFITGIFVGGWMFESKFEDLQAMQNYMSSEILDIEMSYDLASESICDSSALSRFNQELDDAGNKIISLEEKRGSKSKEFLIFKKYYFLLELKHWQFITKINEECPESYHTILYFYQRGLPADLLQGSTLTSLKENNPRVMIYSFDISSDLESLNIIKNKHKIVSAPTLLIDEAIVLEGLQSEERIEVYIQ